MSTSGLSWPAVHTAIQLRGCAGTYRGTCPIRGLHRVEVTGNGGKPTIYLLGADGRARGDGADSPCDFLGAEGTAA